jgi:hypothetical protein
MLQRARMLPAVVPHFRAAQLPPLPWLCIVMKGVKMDGSPNCSQPAKLRGASASARALFLRRPSLEHVNGEPHCLYWMRSRAKFYPYLHFLYLPTLSIAPRPAAARDIGGPRCLHWMRSRANSSTTSHIFQPPPPSLHVTSSCLTTLTTGGKLAPRRACQWCAFLFMGCVER